MVGTVTSINYDLWALVYAPIWIDGIRYEIEREWADQNEIMPGHTLEFEFDETEMSRFIKNPRIVKVK